MSTGSLHLSVSSVAGPGRLVESGPELLPELIMATRGCSWIPLVTGRYPIAVASAPNATYPCCFIGELCDRHAHRRAGFLRQADTAANVSDDPDDAPRQFLERRFKAPPENPPLVERIARGQNRRARVSLTMITPSASRSSRLNFSTTMATSPHPVAPLPQQDCYNTR